MLHTSTGRWVIGVVVVAALVALLAWARNDAGVDGRTPDPEDAVAVVAGIPSGGAGVE